MKTFYKLSICLGTVGALALTGCAPSAGSDKPTAEEKAAKTAQIRPADLKRRIKKLSDDEFEGRAPGTETGEKAAAWIAAEMKRAGLEPLPGQKNYFQPVKLVETTVQPGSYLNITDASGNVDELTPKENSVFWTKKVGDSESFEVGYDDSDLVFVGYGVVAPEYGWNDYESLDVEGKTVVMLVNDPGFARPDRDLFKGKAMTYYGRWTYKYEEAGRQGAAGAIVIHETEPASYGWDVVANSWSGAQIDLERPDGGASRTVMEGWITNEKAIELFENSGLDFAALKEAAAEPDFTPVAMTGLKASTKIVNTQSSTRSRNVAGMVKGSKYPDEYILYMGHWDHIAKNESAAPGEDAIYNGAVDNATGTATILEIGEAFAGQDTPPERSIMVVAVTAEESGLLGSAYFAEDPLVPLNKIVAGINIDAILPIGRTKDMVVVGYGASELEDRLGALIKPRGMYLAPDPNPQAGYFYRSDHISLAKKGVPMLYSDGGVDHRTKGKEFGMAMEADYRKNRYHAVGDEYSDDWDMSGMTETAEILYELGQDLSRTEAWPQWYEGNEFRSVRDASLAK